MDATRLPPTFCPQLNAQVAHRNRLALALCGLSRGGVAGYAAMTPDFASEDPPMDIRNLTPTYAVSPQIAPSDLAALKAAGFTTIIDNRPDGEIPPDLHTGVMQAAAQQLGLTFVANPVIGGAMTMDNVAAQKAAIAAATGPVFAYCASGNRSSVVWALAHAGQMPADDLIGIPAKFGYQLEHLRGQIEALAQG
jgi:uncharacterized protein (TIGR01244 family)